MGWIVVPLIAAFFGWLAGKFALKLLFHPVKPRQLGGIAFQGILPARRTELENRVSQLLVGEMTSLSGELKEKAADPENFQKILPLVEEHIDRFLRVKLVEKMPMIGMLIGERTIVEMKSVFTAELETLFPVVMENYMDTLQAGAGIEEIVRLKIQGLSLAGLEEKLNILLSKELRYWSILGAAAGFLVGLLQVLALLWV